MLTSLTVSEAQADFDRLIDQVDQSLHAIRIVGAHCSAMLVSEAKWNSIQETLFLMSIPGMHESIKAGRAEPLELCVQHLDW